MKYLFIADVKNVGFFILSYLQKHMSIDDTDEVFKGRYWDRFYHHDQDGQSAHGSAWRPRPDYKFPEIYKSKNDLKNELHISKILNKDSLTQFPVLTLQNF